MAVGSISIHRILALFEHVNVHIVRTSSLIMPSGPPVDGTSVVDDLTNLLWQLAKDRKEKQDRRGNDKELRRQDGERLRTQIFEMIDRRAAAASEVAPGVTGERVRTATSAGEARGVSSSRSLPALGEAVDLLWSGASSSVDSHRAEVVLANLGV